MTSRAAICASSHASDSGENAATPASAPKRPVRHSTSGHSPLTTAPVFSDALIMSAHFRPARLYAFEALVTAKPTSAAVDEAARNGVKTPPGCTSGAWISSLMTTAPNRSARSARSASAARECTVPVGLCGLHSRTARAPPARAASIPRRSSSQASPVSRSGTSSTTPPASGMHIENGG